MKLNQSSEPMRNPIIAALDVDSRDQALKLADDLADVVGGFKVGPRLCLRYGQDLVKEVAARAPVFVDNKHFDIPSTMEAAVRASFEAGASLVTVHALSGREALTKMATLEKELSQKRPFKILAVTIRSFVFNVSSRDCDTTLSLFWRFIDLIVRHCLRLASKCQSSRDRSRQSSFTMIDVTDCTDVYVGLIT
jgi:hypothetical protein